MELKIYSPTEDGFVKAIKWNNDEIKKEVAEKVEYYKTLVYTDTQIKDAKRDRAALNKFVQALETKRKEIKKQCLAPYEEFERQMKEIIAIVNEPIRLIDGQIKEYDAQKRAEKLEKIKELFYQAGFPDWLEFERVFVDKWLNTTTTLKSIEVDMRTKLDEINKNLVTLSNLPEFGFEATEVYKDTLDISKAISEGQRLSEIQKRKAEQEAAREAARKAAEEEKARQEFAQHMNPPVDPDDLPGQMNITDFPEAMPDEPQEQSDRQWIGFKAYLTVEDAQAIANLFATRKIMYKQIEV